LSDEQAAAKLRSGIPLLHGERLPLDVVFAGDVFGRLVRLLPVRPDALVEAARQGRLDPSQLFAAALAQHHDRVAALASAAGVDPGLVVALAGFAVGPIVRACAEALVTRHPRRFESSSTTSSWRKGYCPVCGAWPVLGELRGLELQRHLRCSACGSSWPSLRLSCVYCGASDFRMLERLQVEDERRRAVDVCNACRGYLKVLNAFESTPAALLPLEDLASAHLDVAAVERGYQRPAGPGFRLELSAAPSIGHAP
jgi:FdhE protein